LVTAAQRLPAVVAMRRLQGPTAHANRRRRAWRLSGIS
jgi:hypothetical protein